MIPSKGEVSKVGVCRTVGSGMDIPREDKEFDGPAASGKERSVKMYVGD